MANVVVTAMVARTVPRAAPNAPRPRPKMKTAFRTMFPTAPVARTTIGLQASFAESRARLATLFGSSKTNESAMTWR